MNRAVVLGGGPAGLYAALLLARRGIPVTVFERERHPGGLAAGTTVAGMRVDYGSHRLHPSIHPDIIDDLSALMPGELAERPRHGRISLQGRLLSFPLAPLELATRLPLGTTLRLAGGAARATLTPTDTRSFASVVATGLGRPMGELFYYPYAEKIWGRDPHLLSGEQARRRIAADSPAKLIRKALSSTQSRRFLYPVGGFGRIPAAIGDAAARAGVDLRLGAAVDELRPHDGGWAIAARRGEERIRMWTPLVLSTIPVAVLARLIGPPPEIAASLQGLASRAMLLVYLAVEADRWTEYDAHYFPDRDIPFTRVSEPKNYRESPHDPPGRTVVCVEIPCDVGDAVWTASAADIVARVRRGLRAVGLADPGEDAVIRRLPHAYPVYGPDSEAAMDRVFGWLDHAAGVVTFGRQGLFAHDNTHHALAMARAAAGCVSASLAFDGEAWATARRSFADHVVED